MLDETRTRAVPALEWVTTMPDGAGGSNLPSASGIYVGGAMPTYQYRCVACGEMFEHAEHLAEHQTAHPPCPKCGSETVQHAPTQFVTKTSKKS